DRTLRSQSDRHKASSWFAPSDQTVCRRRRCAVSDSARRDRRSSDEVRCRRRQTTAKSYAFPISRQRSVNNYNNLTSADLVRGIRPVHEQGPARLYEIHISAPLFRRRILTRFGSTFAAL